MNTKKNKKKSAKSPKLVQDVQEGDFNVKPEKPDNLTDLIIPECVNKEVIEKPQPCEIAPTIEENQPVVDSPKKPKRNKTKKKPEQLNEEKKLSESTTVTCEETMSEGTENKPQDVTPLTPNIRKKKNKKHKEQSKSSENISEPVTVGDNVKVEANEEKVKPEIENAECTESINKETAEKAKTSAKKKKKKKNRLDSEKSDIIENVPCTLAFQKLLIESKNETESKEKAEFSEIPLLEENLSKNDTILKSNDVLQKEDIETDVVAIKEDKKGKENDEGLKSKKKTKKGKKIPPTDIAFETKSQLDDDNNLVVVPTSDSVLEISEEITKDTSPKPKAKIAKPVDKKRKLKTETPTETVIPLPDCNTDFNDKKDIINTMEQTEATLADGNIIMSAHDGEHNPNKDVINEPKESQEQSNSDIKITSEIDLPNITNIQMMTKEELKVTDIKGKAPDEEVENINVSIQDKQDEENKNFEEFGFVEVKQGKNKKKRNKQFVAQDTSIEPSNNISLNVETPTVEIKEAELNLDTNLEITKSDEIAMSSIYPEELDNSNIRPDLIQYPRSTSQQLIDDNNNNSTIIQEIKTPDELKLGIPIFTSTPIIQGSGESPDTNIDKEPAGQPLRVTEIEPNLSRSSSEKTDIKSKMIEVNQDMEELRRSIERSLAELTAIEKSDDDVEKEFEEVFQNLNQAPVKSDIESKGKKSDTCMDDLYEKTKEDQPKSVAVIESNLETKESLTENQKVDKTEIQKLSDNVDSQNKIPVCPARKDNKGKSKKRKAKQEIQATSNSSNNTISTGSAETNQNETTQGANVNEGAEQKADTSKEKGKQQSHNLSDDYSESPQKPKQLKLDLSYEPIENFEDALTSSADDVNKTFEIIVNEANEATESYNCHNNPEINIIAPAEDIEEDEKQKIEEEKLKKQNPVTPPKNLLGHYNIPVQSNKTDFKKEKNKQPNSIQAKVKIKDSEEIEKPLQNKQSKESQTENKIKLLKDNESLNAFSYSTNANEDFVYKYSFRKVFLQSACHVCKNDLIQRVPCQFCSLVFYCSQKHKDEDWPQHQSLCFAASTIAHLKDQKHIYADAQNITGHDYRVLRMQMIVSCEKILKRKLVPWEQEALLYPRICADVSCREWRQSKLVDCDCCHQISYCMDHPDHLPKTHQRWCKSYALYKKLVNYQQNNGRLEPRLPTKVLDRYQLPNNINEVLGSMYQEKIDMSDIQYATLTQIATAPLTAAFCHQLYTAKMNSLCANGVSKKSTFTIHSVGTELQFEADALNKWEIFFLHLRSDVKDLRVVLVGPDLNPSNLPLDLLGKIKLCNNCQINKRRVIFHFQDKETYPEYFSGDDFITPDIICAFNPNIQRSSVYNIKDAWPTTVNCILKQKVPFAITSYTLEELKRDIAKIKEYTDTKVNIVSEPKQNPFCSFRPDRNFITDHEMPLLFKNYCFSILCGAF